MVRARVWVLVGVGTKATSEPPLEGVDGYCEEETGAGNRVEAVQEKMDDEDERRLRYRR